MKYEEKERLRKAKEEIVRRVTEKRDEKVAQASSLEEKLMCWHSPFPEQVLDGVDCDFRSDYSSPHYRLSWRSGYQAYPNTDERSRKINKVIAETHWNSYSSLRSLIRENLTQALLSPVDYVRELGTLCKEKDNPVRRREDENVRSS